MQLTSRDKTPAARCLLYTRVSRYLRVVQERGIPQERERRNLLFKRGAVPGKLAVH